MTGLCYLPNKNKTQKKLNLNTHWKFVYIVMHFFYPIKSIYFWQQNELTGLSCGLSSAWNKNEKLPHLDPLFMVPRCCATDTTLPSHRRIISVRMSSHLSALSVETGRRRLRRFTTPTFPCLSIHLSPAYIHFTDISSQHRCRSRPVPTRARWCRRGLCKCAPGWISREGWRYEHLDTGPPAEHPFCAAARSSHVHPAAIQNPSLLCAAGIDDER